MSAADGRTPGTDTDDQVRAAGTTRTESAARGDRGVRGDTRIAPDVVARVAAHAAAQVPGVYALVPVPARPHGVAARLDDRVASVDVELVARYGSSVLALADAVRDAVIDQVGAATGLAVREVTVTVGDLVVPGVDPPAPT